VAWSAKTVQSRARQFGGNGPRIVVYAAEPATVRSERRIAARCDPSAVGGSDELLQYDTFDVRSGDDLQLARPGIPLAGIHGSERLSSTIPRAGRTRDADKPAVVAPKPARKDAALPLRPRDQPGLVAAEIETPRRSVDIVESRT
jgi:hypothetical protein